MKIHIIYRDLLGVYDNYCPATLIGSKWGLGRISCGYKFRFNGEWYGNVSFGFRKMSDLENEARKLISLLKFERKLI